MPNELPEPLQDFARIAPAMFERVDELHRVYLEHHGAGRILPNTLEAMRVELTYHSNAIEGSTLTLRDTQLVIEGREPNSGKSLGEIYEARNHDRALRQIESWTSERRGELSESDILALHAAVMADIDRTGAGQFRGDRVLISDTDSGGTAKRLSGSLGRCERRQVGTLCVVRQVVCRRFDYEAIRRRRLIQIRDGQSTESISIRAK